MVDVVQLLKVLLTLFVLGTLSSAIGGLFVALEFKVASFVYGVLVLCLILAVASIVFAILKAESALLKHVLWFLGVLQLTVAIAAPLIPYEFHDDSAYLNRVMVYVVFLTAMIGGLASWWRYLTPLILGDLFGASGVDTAQETLLYVLWAVLESFIMAWFIPFKPEYQRRAEFEKAINYSVGFYFVGGVLAAGIGLIVLFRAGGGGAAAGDTSSPSPKTSEYDNVG
jgi:hypothetical protein